MITIPLQSVPSQTVNVVLAGQNCTLNIYTKQTGMYVDVLLAGALLCSCRVARDGVPIVRMGYTGFVGDIFFIDTQGSDDPEYTGLGTRWMLCYA